jgi:hypothetical protein
MDRGEAPVGVRAATMARGDIGGEDGGVVEGDMGWV